ncbi:phage tail protein [Caenimonas koreensis]|uniref:phage tail protein n=1 Tax=Caenimonas koreensis TaxID=367474 RepID=UPI00378397D8
MGQPYVGEIRMFGGNFAPLGWMLCQGQTMSIAENEVLFNLIGTTYGGDGQETFNLPNLASRVPIHMGTNINTYVIGQASGSEQVTLTTNQIPSHTHQMMANNTAASVSLPSGSILARPSSAVSNTLFYSTDLPVNMSATAVSAVGGNQPHDNTQPYLVINFIISLYGIYPSPT